MDTLKCVVEHITFHNSENGFTVLKGSVKGYPDPVTVVGLMPDTYAGAVLSLQGTWKQDPRYGPQFSVERYEERMPASAYGIEKYLGSGLIKGIGPGMAERIVKMFGSKTLDVIESHPERLKAVPGLGKKRIEKIKGSWAAQKEIKNIMIFLQGHGVSTTHATKIYKTYGANSLEVVKDNPYRLADDIWGIGFKSADQIARKMGFSHDCPQRICSGLLYTLNRLADDGHCYATRSQLSNKGVELLEVPGVAVDTALEDMLREEAIIADGDALYLPAFYFAEVGSAKRIRTLLESKPRKKVDVDKLPSLVKSQEGVTYDDIQMDAIWVAVTSKMMVLTGGPGTGKTTTTMGIISAFAKSKFKVVLAAPTGRAAKRMTEATGMEAQTIHRLLEARPPHGFQRDESCPIEGDVLIVDESSMIDAILMYNLLKAIPAHMTLIMVGDIDQLPSVGAGNVLHDIIQSGAVPVVRLERIFRQAQGSRIITNAHLINKGKKFVVDNSKESDFFFRAESGPEKAVDMIVDLCANRLPSYYGADPMNDIQVLSPMKKGIAGTANLNKRLQEALNPTGICLKRGDDEYRLNDKVMQIRNNYDKEVFNGDIGVVTKVDMVDRELTVTIDGRDIVYEQSELDELVLAYATSIHKAQGAEFPIVVMPFMMTHYAMLQRSLLYTGITRAKKVLMLVGEMKALWMAATNKKVRPRNTKLAERLAPAPTIAEEAPPA